MWAENGSHDRRKEKRKKANIVFLIRIGRLFNGRGIIKDINQHGMCLVCRQIFRPRATMQSIDFIGESLRVMIPSGGIMINGVVAWVDLKKGEGGINVSRTSDENRWQELYETTK